MGPTIFGHTAAAGAVSVAAARYNSTKPERYSSRGPVKHYFGPVNGENPRAPKPKRSPSRISPPTDCGATTFFAFFVSGEATWRFCGTSAAAPHAAGVAALELEEKSGATPGEIREAQTLTADALSPLYGPDAIGAGLLNADDAVGSLCPAPLPSRSLTIR